MEVGPRDGLQSEARVLSVATRVALITRLLDAGLRHIEVASFVHPRLVPQMADAEEVVAGLPAGDDATYIGLVLNARGLERALATSVHEINVVVPASDGYSRSNQRMSQAEATAMATDVLAEATAAGRAASATISVAFGDPVDGDVDPEWVAELAERLAGAGAATIVLGDTIGAGVPAAVHEVMAAIRRRSDVPVRGHFHNTRNTGYANVVAALDAGMAGIETAVGGYGGSPFAPGAGGNVATEDVAHLLARSGYHPGCDLEAIIATARWLSAELGSPIRSMVPEAGSLLPSAVPTNVEE